MPGNAQGMGTGKGLGEAVGKSEHKGSGLLQCYTKGRKCSFYVCECWTYIYVCVSRGGLVLKEVKRPPILMLELQMAVSCHVVLGHQT